MRDQRGSGSLLLGAVVAVLLMVSWVGAVGGAYAVALHRVRGVADRAALAGALAHDQGVAPCPVVRRQITLDGPPHRLVGCRTTGDTSISVVSVSVERTVGVAVPGLPGTVRATAHAGPVGTGEARGWDP